MPTTWMISAYMYWFSFQIKLFNQCAVQIRLITNYKRKMHTCYCYHKIFIKTIRFISHILDYILKRNNRQCVNTCYPLSYLSVFIILLPRRGWYFCGYSYQWIPYCFGTWWIFKRSMSSILIDDLPEHHIVCSYSVFICSNIRVRVSKF